MRWQGKGIRLIKLTELTKLTKLTGLIKETAVSIFDAKARRRNGRSSFDAPLVLRLSLEALQQTCAPTDSRSIATTREGSEASFTLTDAGQLSALRDFFTPLLRSLSSCPRIVVLGTPPELVSGSERVAQRALEGFTRSLGKEIGRGGTVQLAYVAPAADGAIGSTLAFFEAPGVPPPAKSSHPAYDLFNHIALQATDRAEVLAATLTSADMGKLYLVLARAVGRQLEG